MRKPSLSRNHRFTRGIVYALSAAAAVTPSAVRAQTFVDHFNNGIVTDSDTTPGFWNVVIDQTGTAVEPVGGPLTLTASGASAADEYPYTSIASATQGAFNFFSAPVVLSVSGLGYKAGSSTVGLTQFTFTSQGLSSNGPLTEYEAQSAVTVWISALGNTNGQVLMGLKEDYPNASTAFDAYPIIGPIGNQYGKQTLTGQVRSFELILGATFYELIVSHDTSTTNATQVTNVYSGGLNICRTASQYTWATASNPQGDSALSISTQLGGTASKTAFASMNVGEVQTSAFVQTFQGTNYGNWSSTSSWSDPTILHPNGDGTTSNVPNFIGANVEFGQAPYPTTVIADADETLGRIIFDSTQSYTLTVNGGGQGTLHMASRSVNAEIHDEVGNHTIYCPVFFQTDALLTVDQAGSVLTLPYTTAEFPTTMNITMQGAGTAAVGSIAFNTVTLSGGTLQVIANGTPSSVSVVNAITSNGGALDLTNNSMVVRGMTESAVDALVHAQELISSSAGSSPLTGIAVIANQDGQGNALYTSFDGLSVSATDVLVMYTYLGDTNLDGVVDANDLASTLAGMYGGLTGWENGDFNYDGVVNSADLNLLLASLAGQGAPFSNPGLGGAGGAVPEPSSAAMAIPAIALLARRRRCAQTALPA